MPTCSVVIDDGPDAQQCARPVEGYFDNLLAWDKEARSDKIIQITVWTQPIY
jgi:hypothetical protein